MSPSSSILQVMLPLAEKSFKLSKYNYYLEDVEYISRRGKQVMNSNGNFISLLRRVCKIFITTIISIYWKIDNIKSVTQVIKLKA